MSLQSRHCPKCKQDKPISEFYRSRHRKTGLTVYCKDCCDDYKQQYLNVTKLDQKLKQIEWIDQQIAHNAIGNERLLELQARLLASMQSKRNAST